MPPRPSAKGGKVVIGMPAPEAGGAAAEAASARRRQVRKLQKNLTFLKSPLLTLQFAGKAAGSFIWTSLAELAVHPTFYLGVVPLAVVWVVASYVPGTHSPLVHDATLSLLFVLWWLILGILSSIGLGTGMQTGMLFLFPHILKVVYTAEECRTIDFETRTNVWFNPDIPPSQLQLPAPCDAPEDTPMPDYLQLVGKVIVPSLIWGIGTAIGEIPPYHFAYLAASKGEIDDEFQHELAEIEGDHSHDGWTKRMFNDMKAWMIRFIKDNGFMGIYLMSAWPNAAFDLCGMCCGHFQMDFWTFFGALVLGKAFTLRTIQAFGFVAVFSQQYRSVLIHDVIGWALPSTADFLTTKIENFIGHVERGGHHGHGGPGLLAKVWGGFIMLLVGYFVYHATEAIAQDRASKLTDEELREALAPEAEGDKQD